MKVAVLGFGTVGRGVYEMIEKSSFLETGPVLVLPKECDKDFMVTSIDEIVNDKSVDAVVECMGGVETAFKFTSACLKSGKHLVTSNKALVAAKGLELRDIAKQHNALLLFSAACGGAIPVLHNISIAKNTDEIIQCGGILNGTTNFILSSILDGRFKSYDSALKEAQKLGYAEADPTADVSGMDTMRKVMLLSAVAFDKLPTDGIFNEGIENIDLCPKGYGTVKLVGSCGIAGESVYAYVEPVICKKDSLYAAVNSNFNAAHYIGKNSGLITLMGQGAGRYPTASAVLRDLTDLCKNPYSMLSDKCSAVKADNSIIKHKYLVSDGEKAHITDAISVYEMHTNAKQMRSEGKKLFFAAIEE